MDWIIHWIYIVIKIFTPCECGFSILDMLLRTRGLDYLLSHSNAIGAHKWEFRKFQLPSITWIQAGITYWKAASWRMSCTSARFCMTYLHFTATQLAISIWTWTNNDQSSRCLEFKDWSWSKGFHQLGWHLVQIIQISYYLPFWHAERQVARGGGGSIKNSFRCL